MGSNSRFSLADFHFQSPDPRLPTLETREDHRLVQAPRLFCPTFVYCQTFHVRDENPPVPITPDIWGPRELLKLCQGSPMIKTFQQIEILYCTLLLSGTEQRACENGEDGEGNSKPISAAKETVVLGCTENWLLLLFPVPLL